MMRRLCKLILLLAFLAPPAYAGMIVTDEVQAQDERARVKALLERSELASALAKMLIIIIILLLIILL